ncbi:MAG: VWA domain-containing protein [Planctomycetota bacterium]|nr:VWA domain-containing protein [Planctomycetota bacterium]MDA1141401.1 VWA domain-containing protein [Planctomycetota bacterium]
MFDLIARPWALWLLLAVPFIFLQAVRSFADRKGSAKLGIATARSLICIFIILEITGTTFWWERRAGDLYVAYLVDVSDSVTPELRIAAQQQVLAGISEQKDRRQASLVFFGETSETVVPFGEATEASIKEAFETYIKPLPGAAIPGSERQSVERVFVLWFVSSRTDIRGSGRSKGILQIRKASHVGAIFTVLQARLAWSDGLWRPGEDYHA